MRSISLVGLPGTGKSTVGRQLAKRLGWRLFDSDSLIESEAGKPIRSIFELHGEAHFRTLESDVISRVISLEDVVVATGGGAVLRAENRAQLAAKTTVVYLRSTAEEIHRRLRNDRARPLLQGADMLSRLQDLFKQRDPLYREIAHFTMDTGRSPVTSLVNNLLMQLELAGALDPGIAQSPIRPQPGDGINSLDEPQDPGHSR